MAQPEGNAIWPSEPVIIPARIRSLITRFFDTSDSTDPQSGKVFAEELFTEDGFFKTHETCVFQGRAEIAASRQNNSPLIVSRAHDLVKVFASNSPATDVLVLGIFTIELKDGSRTQFDFTARFVASTSTSDAKLRMVQVWTDPTAMKDAFQKATAASQAEQAQ